jgi:general stress protein 26
MEPTPDRPQAPTTYGIGRDGSAPGERLPWSRVEEWLEQSRNYWVCTTRSDGRPHAKPVWGLWMDGMVLFSTSPESVTARNLARSPEAVVHLESGDEVAILEGPIEPWGGDPKLRREFADRYEAKYDHRPEDDDPGTPVFALCPRKALSWTEQEFPSSATRWTF